MKKIAIIGSGISALTTAYQLKKDHEVTIFEKNDYLGGHTNTILVPEGSRNIPVDTGFIVFNDWTYPNFIEMMNELGVESQASDMSFSVKCADTGLEYNGTNMNALFAQRRNFFSPRFWGMIRDIIKFNKAALQWLDTHPDPTEEGPGLDMFIAELGLGDWFRDKYILPMSAAIWSASRESILNFPLRFFINFFKNHGFLNVDDRPVWRVIKGGSNAYIPKIIAGIEDQIRLKSPVTSICRFADRVEITANQQTETFDAVVFGCHSDEALKILGASATPQETEILTAIPYQYNRAILHTDTSVLPKKKLAWAAWNYHLNGTIETQAKLTYNMNILQSLETEKTYCVSLNYDRIDPNHAIKTIDYHHPVFTREGVKAQQRHAEISGVNRTCFAGAYWRYGFHEDGVISGKRAAQQIREML